MVMRQDRRPPGAPYLFGKDAHSRGNSRHYANAEEENNELIAWHKRAAAEEEQRRQMLI